MVARLSVNLRAVLVVQTYRQILIVGLILVRARVVRFDLLDPKAFVVVRFLACC